MIPASSAELSPISFINPDANQEIHRVFQGESELILRIEFPEACLEWSIAFNSSLFKHPFIDHVEEEMNKSTVYYYGGLDVNQNAPGGTYIINITFNYTALDGLFKEKIITYDIVFRRIMEIRTYENQYYDTINFSLRIEIYDDCEEININFFSSGDLRLSPSVIRDNNIHCGTYFFSTNITQVQSAMRVNIIGYIITIKYEGRAIIQENRTIFLTWKDVTQEEANHSMYKTILLSIIILSFIVILDLMYVMKGSFRLKRS